MNVKHRFIVEEGESLNEAITDAATCMLLIRTNNFVPRNPIVAI